MSTASKEGALAWDVMLPGKRAAQNLGYKPKGTVVIDTDDGVEYVKVPKPVATLLNKKRNADEIHPSSRAELLYLVGELSKSCARARIERLINAREYSCSEVSDKLYQDGYSKWVVDECVLRAKNAGLLSDVRFADSFIRSKVSAGWSMGRISAELSRRGIDVSELSGWPYEYLDPEDEYSRAVELIRNKRVSGPNAYQKLVRYLCGRGYTIGVSTRAAQHVISQEESGFLVDF